MPHFVKFEEYITKSIGRKDLNKYFITVAILAVAGFVDCCLPDTAIASMSCWYFFCSGFDSSPSPTHFRAIAYGPMAPLTIN